MEQNGSSGFSTAFKTGIISTLYVPDRPEWTASQFIYARQVLEFMGGGDLLNLLIEKDVFEENFARFYIAEVGDFSRFFGVRSDH
jgi:hypothetical protein